MESTLGSEDCRRIPSAFSSESSPRSYRPNLSRAHPRNWSVPTRSGCTRPNRCLSRARRRLRNLSASGRSSSLNAQSEARLWSELRTPSAERPFRRLMSPQAPPKERSGLLIALANDEDFCKPTARLRQRLEVHLVRLIEPLNQAPIAGLGSLVVCEPVVAMAEVQEGIPCRPVTRTPHLFLDRDQAFQDRDESPRILRCGVKPPVLDERRRDHAVVGAQPGHPGCPGPPGRRPRPPGSVRIRAGSARVAAASGRARSEAGASARPLAAAASPTTRAGG